MKRKRGNVKRKPKNPFIGEAKEAVPNVAGLPDYLLEDLLSEEVAMEVETPQAETNRSVPALDKFVANERMEDNVNSLRKTNKAGLGNLSKFAGSVATKSSRDGGSYAKNLETETPRAHTNMGGLQADLVKGGVNGRMENCPPSIREMIISIISDLSKEAGGITTKLPRDLVDNVISDAPPLQPQGDRTHQEQSSLLHQNPRYKEQELNAALSVIKKIMKLEVAEPFSVPVDPIALGILDYFDVIDTPMDFGTICNNLENGLKYMNSDDVYKDVQYIWRNCCKYNKKGDYILELMKRVKTSFMKYWTAAGLHVEQAQAIDGYSHLPLPTESSMTGSKCWQECPVGPITHKLGPNQAQTHQPALIHRQAYQPHLNSNQPQPSSQQQADASATSTTGYSHLQLPTECTMSHSMRRQECPVVLVTDKISPSHIQSDRPSSIDNQPHLSTNQPQPSLQHTDTDTGSSGELSLPLSPTTESILTRSKRGKQLPVTPISDILVHQQQDKAGSKRRPLSNDSQAYQTPLSSNQSQPSPQQGDANAGTVLQIDSNIMQRKRQVRGPTRCLKLLTTVGRITVATNDLGQPIGLEASMLTSFLGLIARDGNLAPLTYPKWSQMPDENKESMWQKVLLKFDINPESKSWVLMSIGTKWRNFKCLLKVNHYDTHETDAERLADCDDRVLPDQWATLVSHWSSEKWQNMSAKNKANRAKQIFNHTAGKKSFARIREEERAKRADGKDPSRAELFILTRTRKNGQPVNEESAAAISQLREQTAQQQETLQNSSRPVDDVFAQVMGQDRHGSVRMYGLGSPSELGTRKSTRVDAMRMVSVANAEVKEVKDKLVTMEQTCAQMAAQMATMMSMMASMQKISPDKHASNVVAEASEGLQLQPVGTSTSRRVAPSRQTRARKRR